MKAHVDTSIRIAERDTLVLDGTAYFVDHIDRMEGRIVLVSHNDIDDIDVVQTTGALEKLIAEAEHVSLHR